MHKMNTQPNKFFDKKNKGKSKRDSSNIRERETGKGEGGDGEIQKTSSNFMHVPDKTPCLPVIPNLFFI